MFKFKTTFFYGIIQHVILQNKLNISHEDQKMIIGLLCNFSIINKNYIKHLSKILNNQFTSDYYKSLSLDIYCIAKKYMNSLQNILRIIKIKKLLLKNNNDIGGLDDIKLTKDHLKFYLIENNSKYCFKFSDIISIINNSLLSNTADFYSEPVLIKNPYTNIPFSLSSLYNIYFNLKKSTFIMPTLFDLYMKSDFNLTIFANDYETVIRDMLIKKYITNLTFNNYVKEIKKMFKDSKIIGLNNSEKLRKINSKMPANIILNVFKPFVDLYIYTIYTLNSNKKFISKNLLYKKITGFVKENPNFGRKIVHTKKNKTDLFIFSGLAISNSSFITDIKNNFYNINIQNMNNIDCINNQLQQSNYQQYWYPTLNTISTINIPDNDTIFVLNQNNLNTDNNIDNNIDDDIDNNIDDDIDNNIDDDIDLDSDSSIESVVNGY